MSKAAQEIRKLANRLIDPDEGYDVPDGVWTDLYAIAKQLEEDDE